MDKYIKNVTVWQENDALINPWKNDQRFLRLATKQQVRQDLTEAVLRGWFPPAPIISPETRVMAFGSCFASSFIVWLAENGFNKNVAHSPYNSLLRYGSCFENLAVIEQQFRWAIGEFDAANTLWIDKDKSVVRVNEEQRLLVKETLEQTDVLIITLGLSEVWYDNVTGEPLWRRMPSEHYEEGRHVFRVESLARTVELFEKIHLLREKFWPQLKIVYTVSPIRLAATFRPISAITANSASKAILRAALDEFLRNHKELVNQTYFYFPSYELVLECFESPFIDDNRHIYESIPPKVMSLFARHYTTFEIAQGKTSLSTDNPQQALYNVIAELEEKNEQLQQACDERLAVINNLNAVCQERLTLIESLSGGASEKARLQEVCDERQVVINDLKAVCQERLALIESLNEEAERRLQVINQLNDQLQQQQASDADGQE